MQLVLATLSTDLLREVVVFWGMLVLLLEDAISVQMTPLSLHWVQHIERQCGAAAAHLTDAACLECASSCVVALPSPLHLVTDRSVQVVRRL